MVKKFLRILVFFGVIVGFVASGDAIGANAEDLREISTGRSKLNEENGCLSHCHYCRLERIEWDRDSYNEAVDDARQMVRREDDPRAWLRLDRAIDARDDEDPYHQEMLNREARRTLDSLSWLSDKARIQEKKLHDATAAKKALHDAEVRWNRFLVVREIFSAGACVMGLSLWKGILAEDWVKETGIGLLSGLCSVYTPEADEWRRIMMSTKETVTAGMRVVSMGCLIGASCIRLTHDDEEATGVTVSNLYMTAAVLNGLTLASSLVNSIRAWGLSQGI